MARYTGIYAAYWSVEIEADNYEEAKDILSSYDNQDIIGTQRLVDMELYLEEVIEEQE